MGVFHCPMGAAFYDDDNCIDCGMCEASTEAEKVEASKKIRAYIKAHAQTNGNARKIAICGKGGVGKSSLVALMANILKEDHEVIVLDTEESNPGLFRMLGFNECPRPLVMLLREPSTEKRASDGSWYGKDRIGMGDIPLEYVLTSEHLRFMVAGKIEDPFQGCACAMADVSRDLIGKLTLEDEELVLIDVEAGVESFGRGVERNVDTVLIVVESSFDSIVLAERIAFMAEGMGISRVHAILNKVSSESVRSKLSDEMSKRNIKVIGAVFMDPTVSEAGFLGIPLGKSKAMNEVRVALEQVVAPV